MTLSSALSLVFKAIPRSLVVEIIGMFWVLVKVMGREGVNDVMGGSYQWEGARFLWG